MILFETDRFIFRELTVADAASFYALNSDPEVIRYTGDSAFANVQQAYEFLYNYADYTVNGYGRWAVLSKENGDFVGWNGLKYGVEGTDLGFRFFRKYWNQGYASETSAAVIRFGFGPLNLSRIIGRVMKDNSASVRVLEKAGFSFVGDFGFNDRPGLLYQIMNPAFTYHGYLTEQ